MQHVQPWSCLLSKLTHIRARPAKAPLALSSQCRLTFSCTCLFPVPPPTEDWAVWDLPRDYSPLHAMPHLTRLTLNIVEELESNMPALLSLTQARC